MNKWFNELRTAMRTVWSGFSLTLRHFRRAILVRKSTVSVMDDAYFADSTTNVTIQYPAESIPVPETGRYRLHMETDDCIVCDQCARICPVDCITIEKIKSIDVVGLTSDGSKKKFWLPTFDIDMAKCCYCGLCTIVCPTECLTMTRAYDYSEFDRENLTFHFGDLSPEEAQEKIQALEAYEAAKREAKQNSK